MRFSEFLKSGSYTFPAPTEYQVDYEDIDSENTTRDQRAYTHRDRLRAEVKKLHVRWKLTPDQLEAVAAHLRPASFTLTYLDLTLGEVRTSSFNCPKKSAKLIVNSSDPSGQWIDFSANIVEM